MSGDIINYAMTRACRGYGGSDGLFNGAQFAAAMVAISGCRQLLDGRMVEALLSGRDDVTPLRGGSYYRMELGVEP